MEKILRGTRLQDTLRSFWAELNAQENSRCYVRRDPSSPPSRQGDDSLFFEGQWCYVGADERIYSMAGPYTESQCPIWDKQDMAKTELHLVGS